MSNSNLQKSPAQSQPVSHKSVFDGIPDLSKPQDNDTYIQYPPKQVTNIHNSTKNPYSFDIGLICGVIITCFVMLVAKRLFKS